MTKWPVHSISVALYDEPWREKAFDKMGIRVRVTRVMRYASGKQSKHRDYYLGLGLLKLLPGLAWNYYFMSFEMKDKIRLSIHRQPAKPKGSIVYGIYVDTPYEDEPE